MPSAPPIQQVEQRLFVLGGSPGKLRRKVRELADHHDDLKQAALEEGLSEADAEARADEQLGKPAALAEQLALVLRRSSWWGRHPFIGFCLLPVLALWPACGLCLLLMCGGYQITNWLPGPHISMHDMAKTMSDEPDTFHGLFFAANMLITCGAVALLAAFFSWRARRSISGLKWALIGCGVCALNGLLCRVTIAPHLVTFGYGANLYGPPLTDWLHATGALLVAGFLLLRYRLRTKSVATNSPIEKLGADRFKSPLSFPRPAFITPSSVIAALLAAALAGSIYLGVKIVREGELKNHELNTRVWPKESAAAAQQVRLGQTTRQTSGEATINLRSFVNAGFSAPIASHKRADEGNLSELPAGIHTYGGVPFDVEGRLQLMGRGYCKWNQPFPTKIRSIPVGRQCEKLFLLHGASFVDAEDSDDTSADGREIARLVLHYADGSHAELGIAARTNVLECHGPTYTTDVDSRNRYTTSPDAVLAWISDASNSKKSGGKLPLRLYRRTFKNPHPDLEVSTIDYVSTLTEAAPFMVGLTVE